MVCLLDDSASSSYSDYNVESLLGSGSNSDFKVFNNILYNEELNMDQPTTCPNIYKGALHGIVNPLFEDRNDLLDEDCVVLNCDSLSLCCKRPGFSSSDCGSDYDLDPLVGEVHDRLHFEDQPALHERYFVDYSYVFTSVSCDWEYSSKQNDSMQEPIFADGYKYVPEYAGWYFYSEQILNNVSPPINYENDGGFFLLPEMVIKNVYDGGKRNDIIFFGFPLMDVTKNQVFNKGKCSL